MTLGQRRVGSGKVAAHLILNSGAATFLFLSLSLSLPLPLPVPRAKAGAKARAGHGQGQVPSFKSRTALITLNRRNKANTLLRRSILGPNRLDSLEEKIMQKRNLIFAGIIVLLMAAGRADDALKPDDEGFIRNWLVLAPLPFGGAQDGAEALGKQQVPDEAKLQPKEGDKIKVGDAELTWKPFKAESHLLDFNAFLGKETEDSVGYAVCYLVADSEMKD